MDEPARKPEHGTVSEQHPLILICGRSQHLGELGGGHLAQSLTDQLTDVGALRPAEFRICERRHDRGDRLVGERAAQRLVLAPPERRPDGGAGEPGGAVDRRRHRRFDQRSHPVGLGPGEELLREVRDGQDLLGDDLGVHVGDLVLPSDEQASPADRTVVPPFGGLVDHPERDPVGHVADDHPEQRQQPPVGHEVGQPGDRDPEQEAEREAEVTDERQFAPAHVEEHAVGELSVEATDHEQLDVDELVDVLADHRGQVADDLGELPVDALPDQILDAVGELGPQPRMLAPHHPVDDRRGLAAQAADHLLGDPRGVELLEEFARRAELRDPDIDGDAAHLRGARGDDPLPADAADHHARHLLDAIGEPCGDPVEPIPADATELHGVEEHQDGRPVGHIADSTGDERHGQERDRAIAPAGHPADATEPPLSD